MKKLISRIFNKVSKQEIDRENMEIICNNPPSNLDRFCSIEYANMYKRSY